MLKIDKTTEKTYIKNYIYNIKSMMQYIYIKDKDFYRFIRYETPKVIWDIVYHNEIEKDNLLRINNITKNIQDIREDKTEILVNYYISIIWEYVTQYILNNYLGFNLERNGEDKDPTKNKGFKLEADLIDKGTGELYEVTHQSLKNKTFYIKKYKLDFYSKNNTNMVFISFNGEHITLIIEESKELKNSAIGVKNIYNKEHYILNNVYTLYNI